MQGQPKIQQMPFQIQQVGSKPKKKSVLSQKMKERKQKISKQKGNQNNNHKKECVSDDEPVSFKNAKQIPYPSQYDHINYISLQEFQGTIEDQTTLEAFQGAIQESSHLFQNKIILHLTSGCNCFYSIYAAEAGASKVYCVVSGHTPAEQQNVWMMQQIVKENQLDQIIQVKCWKDFNAEIDVIIGQPMGFCMHYDGLLDRMIEARDLYLDKKNGLIFPDKLKFKCAFIHDEHFYDKKIQFWDEVYSIPMKSMQKWISHEPIVKIVDPSLIVSQIHKFIEFDLLKVTYQQIEELTREFSLEIYEKTMANGLTIWFEIQFNCEGSKIQLKGSPWQQATKFTHVTLYMSKKLEFKEGQTVKIKMYGKRYPHHGVSVMKVNVDDKIEGLYTFS